jgi:hypothetical protein
VYIGEKAMLSVPPEQLEEGLPLSVPTAGPVVVDEEQEPTASARAMQPQTPVQTTPTVV